MQVLSVLSKPALAQGPSTSMIGQAMPLQYSTDSCINCGRIEIVMRGCPSTNHPNRCAACRDKQVAKQQIAFGKLHIAKHKLPHILAMRIYDYVYCHISHRHARRRFLYAIILKGKDSTRSSLHRLHHQLAAQTKAWHTSNDWYRLCIWGHRSDFWSELTDWVIGMDTRQPKSWCPWCHGSGCF